MPEYTCYVEMIDAFGRRATKRFQSDPAVLDFATALSNAADLVADLAALSELRVLAYTVGQRVTYSDTVDTGANKDEGATLVVELIDNKRHAMKVPGPIQTIRNADGTIDVTDASVLNYVANFLDGSTLWTVSDGETVSEVLSGTLDK